MQRRAPPLGAGGRQCVADENKLGLGHLLMRRLALVAFLFMGATKWPPNEASLQLAREWVLGERAPKASHTNSMSVCVCV